MKLDSLFYSLYLGSLDRLFDIQMREGAGASVCAEILHRMDQAMKDFSTVTTSPSLQVNTLFWLVDSLFSYSDWFTQNFINLWLVDLILFYSLIAWYKTVLTSDWLQSHFRGQLFLNSATLLIKRAVKDEGSWRDTSKLVGLLYLGAHGCDLVSEWSGVGSMRKVVSGHMLQSLSGADKQWSDRILGVGSNVGDKLFKAVFIVRDQRDKQVNTFLWLVNSIHS